MTSKNLPIQVDKEARADAPASFGRKALACSERRMCQIGAFTLGVIVGVVGVRAMTAIMEEMDIPILDRISRQNPSAAGNAESNNSG